MKERMQFNHTEGRALIAHEMAHVIIMSPLHMRILKPLLTVWNLPLALSAHCITRLFFYLGWRLTGGNKVPWYFDGVTRICNKVFEYSSERSWYAIRRAEKYVADMVGALLLRDTYPMILMLSKLQEIRPYEMLPNNLEWRITHPLYRDRIRALEATQCP